jgi:Domain of unknown function (DUF4062)
MKRKLQVFVSSTYSDLIEERQAAVAAILKAGHIPAGMELFTAGDISQMETIKRWIDESDVYMLILGGRYGSMEPTTNLSYSELEYDYAREQGKSLFAVVIQEEALEERIKKGGSVYIEKENPKALHEFRRKVLTNISSFFSDSKDIKLCVHESLADFAVKPGLKGWVSVDEVPDTKTLNNEIESLRKENAALLAELQKTNVEGERKTSSADLTADEKIEILEGIEIKVPAEISSGGNEFTTNLLDICQQHLGMLVNGVDNRMGMSPLAKLLYFNAFPRLQMLGLAENEPVPNVRYRRSVLNATGRALFARIEQKNVRAKT